MSSALCSLFGLERISRVESLVWARLGQLVGLQLFASHFLKSVSLSLSFSFSFSRCLCLRLLGDIKITSTSTERQKRSQNLAPVLIMIYGNSLVFSRKIITSTGLYRCCAPGASAPVVVKNQTPISVCSLSLSLSLTASSSVPCSMRSLLPQRCRERARG